MGAIDKVRRMGRKLAGGRHGRSGREDRGRGKRGRSGGEGSLPGGAGSREAAEANPQRAAELAD